SNLLDSVRLPRTIEVSVNKDQAASLFQLARDGWDQAFKPKELKTMLKAIAREESGALSAENRAVLKALRTHSAILRSAFTVFGEGHTAHEALHDFVQDFGKLNDAIESGAEKEIPKASKRLLKSLDPDSIEKGIDGFEPSNRKSFDDFIEDAFKKIR